MLWDLSLEMLKVCPLLADSGTLLTAALLTMLGASFDSISKSQHNVKLFTSWYPSKRPLHILLVTNHSQYVAPSPKEGGEFEADTLCLITHKCMRILLQSTYLKHACLLGSGPSQVHIMTVMCLLVCLSWAGVYYSVDLPSEIRSLHSNCIQGLHVCALPAC